MALATAPVYDPDLDRIISTEVASDLIGKVAGRRVAMTVARRVPLLGGVVGMGVDGFVTWRIGRYADRELLARPRASTQDDHARGRTRSAHGPSVPRSALRAGPARSGRRAAGRGPAGWPPHGSSPRGRPARP